MSRRVRRNAPAGPRSGRLRRTLKFALKLVLLVYTVWLLSLFALRLIDPITTTVQIQRRVAAWISWKPYDKHYTFRDLHAIPLNLQHAVIAAEDSRFYEHSGIDWRQMELAFADAREESEPLRGASTITQQLIKNLFFTTHRNPARKAVEYTLAPAAELLLGKERILELYLNVAEWGPGVFGAEAAAQYHYGVPAARLTRDQAARLAACLPAPLRRQPARMTSYAGVILARMNQMGW